MSSNSAVKDRHTDGPILLSHFSMHRQRRHYGSLCYKQIRLVGSPSTAGTLLLGGCRQRVFIGGALQKVGRVAGPFGNVEVVGI